MAKVDAALPEDVLALEPGDFAVPSREGAQRARALAAALYDYGRACGGAADPAFATLLGSGTLDREVLWQMVARANLAVEAEAEGDVERLEEYFATAVSDDDDAGEVRGCREGREREREGERERDRTLTPPTGLRVRVCLHEM